MKQVINNNSIGPIGLMWVVLVTLKLMAVVDWSWWIVVFFPLLATMGITALFAGLGLVTGGLVWLFCRD